MADLDTTQPGADPEDVLLKPQPDVGPDPITRLLKLARDEVDKGAEKGNLRLALEYLERYRDEVIRTEKPRRVFDTLPILRNISEAWGAPSSVRDDARQFVQTTATLLEPWPNLVQQYEESILESELDAIELRRRLMLFTLLPLLGVAISIGGIAAVIVGVRDDVASAVSIAGTIAIAGGAALAGIAFVVKRARDARLTAEEENLRRKLKLRALPTAARGVTKPSDTTGGEYFGNLVRINVDNLSDYYTQVRVHTNNSFWASIVAGGLGFVLIAVGLGWGFSDSGSNSQSLSYVATGSGVFVEFISGVFFYLYNRTVRQLKDYHDSLLDVQNILLSFRIVEQSKAEHQGALFDKILGFLLQQRGHGTMSPPLSASDALRPQPDAARPEN
jgi:hypothetical protein